MINYHLDLKKYSLNDFKELLNNYYLVKSRKLLLDNIDEKFEKIENQNIKNIDELNKILKNKSKIENLADKTSIDIQYLTILKREINSYLPNPTPLKKLENVSDTLINKLSKHKINNTKHVIEKLSKKKERKNFALENDIDYEELTTICKYSDLARIGGIGPTFIKILYEADIDSVDIFIKTPHKDMIERVNKLIKEKSYYRGSLGNDDIEYCIIRSEKLDIVLEL